MEILFRMVSVDDVCFCVSEILPLFFGPNDTVNIAADGRVRIFVLGIFLAAELDFSHALNDLNQIV